MHKLETQLDENGKIKSASFVTVKERAWHGLGTVVPNQLTSAECLRIANMNYTVEKTPCIVNIAGEQITSKDQFAIHRTDKKGEDAILGYVGSGYTPLQNTEAFEFFDNIVGAGEAFYETAGVLGKGERIFLTAKLPEHFDIAIGAGKSDRLTPYIFLTNSHDGKGTVVAAVTYTRIVCNNTLQMALKDCKNKFTLRHTKNMRSAMDDAMTVMGITNQYHNELSAIIPAMAKTKIDQKGWAQIVATAFTDSRIEKQKLQLKDYLKGSRDNKKVSQQFINTIDAVRHYDNVNYTQQMGTTEGTVWGAVNAVTGYLQNVQTDNDNNKLASILDGSIARATQTAWDTAMKFMKN